VRGVDLADQRGRVGALLAHHLQIISVEIGFVDGRSDQEGMIS
jgi:hypothetical protein